jgi:hypothetical protein
LKFGITEAGREFLEKLRGDLWTLSEGESLEVRIIDIAIELLRRGYTNNGMAADANGRPVKWHAEEAVQFSGVGALLRARMILAGQGGNTIVACRTVVRGCRRQFIRASYQGKDAAIEALQERRKVFVDAGSADRSGVGGLRA